MRFTAYVMLMICLSLVLFFMGGSPLVHIYNSEAGANGEFVQINNPCDIDDTECNQQYEGALLQSFGSVIAAGALGVVLSLILGYSAMYVIPLVMILVILNFFVFPVSELFGTLSEFSYLYIPIVVIYNVLTVLAIAHFVRGSG